MNSSAPSEPKWTAAHYLLNEPLLFGTLCGLFSAVGYTAANACLRSVTDCHPVWVSFAKAIPTLALFGPGLVAKLARGTELIPSWQQMRALVIAALICQLCGNVVFQWSLGVIGMALTIPLTLGTMIMGAAIMGRLFLYEPVTPVMACSLLVLIVAVCVLSIGAADESQADLANAHLTPGPSRPIETDAAANLPAGMTLHFLVLAGVGAACLAGVAYATLGVAIRSVVTNSMSLSMTMVIVTLAGVVALGPVGLWRPGLPAILATSPQELGFMMLAGLFNAAAFLALTKSLQLVPVAYVNALNATQAAMGALAGVLLFHEPSSWFLWSGVGLTAAGLLMMRRPGHRPRTRN